MIRKTSEKIPELEYFVKGDNPKLLIHSGTHGDEFDVVEFVKKAVEKYEDMLPDFVFVPVVSPSAVNLRTRFNKNGHDLNRTFFDDSEDLEVMSNIEIIGDNKFELFVSFHEDFEFFDYYIYDEGFSNKSTPRVLKNNKNIHDLGINLFSGVDDPILNTEFVDGYKKFDLDKNVKNNGMITTWMLSTGRVIDTLTPEIPMRIDLSLKEKIVDTFFKDVLCND